VVVSLFSECCDYFRAGLWRFPLLGANADADTDSAKKSPSGMLQHQHSSFTIHHSASVVLKDYKRFLEKWQSDYSMLPW